jgi:hypothetical protein
MPDWQQLVRHRLALLNLDAAEREEVCDELAAHLEDHYQYSLAAGATEELAIRRALRHVHDWHDLKAKIESSRKKEPPMNKRVTQFWFPAFLTVALSMVLLAVIQIFGPDPWVSPIMPGGRLRMTPVAVVYVAWLVFLPLIGALGAYLSKRAGGGPRAVFYSVVFPVFPYVAFFVIGLPLALILDDRVAHNITIPAFFVGLAGWVIFPAIALLAGGLPVHFFSARKVSM